MTKTLVRTIVGAALAVALFFPSYSYAQCLSPPGDITSSGSTNVSDVQCNILVTLWFLGGEIGPKPICLTVDPVFADLNCDGVVNVADVVISINFALNLSMNPAIDANGNNCADICENDSDGDGIADFIDCVPNNPSMYQSNAEICNGYDDDCDGLIDEAAATSVATSCSDNDVCNGIEACPVPPVLTSVTITELMINPGAASDSLGEWIELFNPTTTKINIQGWRLIDLSGQIHVIDNSGPLYIKPGGYLVLGRSVDKNLNGGLLVNYVYVGFELSDGTDQVILRNAQNVEVDRVDYTAGTFPIIAGASIALMDNAANNNLGASWATSTATLLTGGDTGSPGGPNIDVYTPPTCLLGTDLDCVDAFDCTVDSCDPVAGCQHVADHAVCGDGDFCNGAEVCVIASGCQDGPDLVCNDNDACTADSCDPATGCVFTSIVATCVDGNPCTDDSCNPSVGCVYVNNTLDCDDNDACTTGDVCSGGLCVSGAPTACDDLNLCTTDSCNSATGCVFANNTIACDDGNACTSTDTCASGSCVPGPAVDCDDNNVCTDDACDPATGCVYENNTDGCDDSDACTTADTCAGGVCVGGLPPDCDDSNPCTTDSCDSGSGCVNANNSLPCDDNDACTTSDTCAAGACVGGPAPDCDDDNVCTDDSCDSALGCQNPHNIAVCDDGDACTSGDVCDAGGCIPGSIVDCDDSNPCTDDSCVPETGCVYVNNTNLCDDNDACTSGDVCTGGACVPGSVVDCDDGNVCTDDDCDSDSACTHVNNISPCDDSDACTNNDVCAAGACTPGVPVLCDDLNVCTDDDCEPATGCVYVNNTESCDDGDACTSGDSCEDGLCAPGAPLICDDGNLCTDDDCDPVTGCTTSAVECGDGNACTSDICLPAAGCLNSPVPCNDGTACTIDGCDPDTGCTFTPVDCDDGDICTADSCNPGTGCTTTPVNCNDNNACTADVCDPGTGCVSTAIVCNDGSVCTTDSCNPAAGCTTTPVTCDDGDACTADACDPITGCFVSPIICNDTNPCTTDSCDSAVGCLTAPVVCDDGNACTADVCNPAVGCTAVPVNCNDGNPCNGAELCNPATGCVPGAPLLCDDGNPCTDDLCAPTIGCYFVASVSVACLPPGAICAVSGTAGSVVTCPLQMARATFVTPKPVGSQIEMTFDPAALSILGFQDTFCAGPNNEPPCATVPVPPAGLYPSGHTVVPFPAPSSSWPGVGNLLIFNTSQPDAAITEAYGSGGGFALETLFLEMQVQLNEDIDPANPQLIMGGLIKGVTADASEMTGVVTAGVIVMSAVQCTGIAGLCDDENLCTTDSCDPTTGNCVHEALTCDDGDICNGTEVCAPLSGCQPGVPLGCSSDGNVCTSDGCDPILGCNPPVSCDDNVLCTSDTCDPVTGCGHTPVDAACDDGFACTTNVCDADSGCVTQTNDALCDDGNDCTTDACVVGQGCVHIVQLTDGCLPANALCGFSGTTGTIVDCPIRLARATNTTPSPVALQFTLTMAANALQAIGFFDDICIGPGGGEPCIEVQVPPASLSPTGHQMGLFPADVATWAGVGKVTLFHLSDPTTAINDAYQSVGNFVGDTNFVLLRLQLTANVDPQAPAYVYSGAITAATSDATKMNGTVVTGVMVVSVADCTEFAGVCDDGSACTTDVCDPVTKKCVSTPVDCDDGNVCNGEETCDITAGCQPGTPLLCESDDDLCTQATCDPSSGCNAPVSCDDGIGCTDDSCDSETGCVHVANAAACDDGHQCTTDSCDLATGCVYATDNAICDDLDPCTADSCLEGQGCVHAPLLTPTCLPPFAFCGVAGAAGSSVVCLIQLGRLTQDTPVPAGAQFFISYNDALLTTTAIQDTVCFGPGGTEPCALANTPPLPLFPSGHQVVIQPPDVTSWAGVAQVLLFHVENPSTALSNAYKSGGVVTGDPQLAELHVTLDQDIPATAPVYLYYSDVKGTTALADEMFGTVENGVMLLGLADCNQVTGVCDDGDACSTDTCLPDGSCDYSPVVCDDANVCNGTETCDLVAGCLPGQPLLCPDDNNACTQAQCEPVLGCNAPINCDDGLDCTTDACDSLIGCVHTPDDGACDDGQVCSLDQCDANLGCVYQENLGVCDDADPCTTDACNPGVGCEYAPVLTAACLPPNTFCGVVGTTGQTVTCEIRMARATPTTPAPASSQFDILFDSSKLVATKFQDYVCFGPGGTEPCADVDTPPQNLYPTGHSVTLVGPDPTAWIGSGSVVLFNASDPSSALTDAAFSGGTFVGDTLILTLLVELKTDISPLDPAYLSYDEIKGATATAEKMTGNVASGVMVLGLADCTTVADICDDANACTADLCDPTTKVCVYTTIQCDDGDVCNGLETCDPSSGCVAGQPLSCVDDDDPCTKADCDPVAGCNAPDDCNDGVSCTEDSCDPVNGCTHVAQNSLCDDGVACTIGVCDADTGCEYTADNAVCDDGDDCTTDICDPVGGCEHPPVLAAHCLPAGVLCGVVGNVGDDVVCPIHIARGTLNTALPTAAQFTVTFDPGAVQPQTLRDLVCLGLGGTEPCVLLDTPPATLFPSGHTVAVNGPVPSAWPGTGNVAMFNASDPTAAVSDAYLLLGAVDGDSLVAELVVKLTATVSANSPAYITLSDVKGSTATAQKMNGVVQNGVMILSLANCNDDPQSCDDGNLCTQNQCEAGGECTSTAVNCDDGDVCNGAEQCEPLSGCQPGTPLDCPDDGDACTVETCDPATGCVTTPSCDDSNPCTVDTCNEDAECAFVPDDSLCDDGVACTTDTCDAIAGCTAAPADAACNDNDPCTTDVCDATQGCQYLPVLTATCLPDGAICGFAGGVGETKICNLSLARATVETGVPTGVQFDLSYNATDLSLTALTDLVCFGPLGTEPCLDLDTPPATLYPSGHTVTLNPSSLGAWNGAGSVVIFNLADPSSPVTDAYLQFTAIIGSPGFADLHVELTSNIDAATPAYIYAANIKGSTATAQKLTGTAQNGLLVLQDAGCDEVCDDENACTDDYCDAQTATCVYEAKVCDDNNVCNGTETCNPSTGCVAGTALTCNPDEDPCTLDGCDPVVGCNPPDLCDDGIECTSSACDPVAGCTYSEINSACDDGIGCTADFCSAAIGCWYQADSLACDDGDPCTADVCEEVTGCQYLPESTPTCLPPGTFCAVSGLVGSTVECNLKLARSTETTPDPTGAQFGVVFDNSLLSVSGIVDLTCFGPGGTEPCLDVTVPPGTLYPSGHTVVVNPANPASWNGTGSVAIFHPSDPTAPITAAYLEAGQLQGDAEFARLVVTLDQNISSLSPTYLSFANIKGSTASAQPMTGITLLGAMVLSLKDCNELPGVCDDGDACTTDVCDAVTGGCVYSPIPCDDGDVCNGVESCDVATGCVAGVALVCEDDGNLCTDDTCDPALGCNSPLTCDDGIVCTDDSCNPASGCVATANNAACDDGFGCTTDVCDLTTGCVLTPSDAACDDGDPCTSDSCGLGVGCIYEVLVTTACLPDGAFCGVAGTAGAVIDCPVRLARLTQNTPEPTGAQFTIDFDAALVQPEVFQDFACFGPGGTEPCATVDVPPANLYPSGHTVVLSGPDPTTWPGTGDVVTFNTTDPTAAVSPAYLFAGGVVGDSEIVVLKVKLTANIPTTAPAYLSLANIKGSTATALKMTGTVQSGTMVLALADCTIDPAVCDDGDACTTESCDIATKTCQFTPVDCIDGDVCNGTETCDPQSGCQPGLAVTCADDGDLCTLETCDPIAGCTYPSPCDDGVGCTVDGCDPDDGSCSVTADNSACDDGIGCTLDVCDEVTGCEYTANAGACDDGNPCTVDSCDLSTGCVFTPLLTAACLPNGAVCGFAGAASSTQTCELRLARATVETGVPAGAQFRLVYPASQLTVTSLQDLVCFGPGGTEPCAMVDVPPQALYPTGHTVKLTPATVNTWSGVGNVVLFNLADPSSAVSGAYLSGGTVIGDAVFMTLTVTLTANIPAGTPVYVQAQSIKGSTPTAGALTGFATAGTMVLQDAGCAAICDDGNACTVDTCNLTTGACEFVAKVCDDGDVCTGAETCNPATGCVAGTTLTCPDDGNACTLAGCDPTVGCNAPDPCDDGITCTSTACDPGVGCTYAEQNGLCDDGLACTADFCSAATGCWHETDDAACDDNDPCTADVCVEGEGCQHPPLLTPECLPAGTFCGVTGNAGDTVECLIRVARSSQAMPEPASAQFDIGFSSALVQVMGMTDLVCLGPGGTEPCVDLPTPPANLYPSGHTVVLNGADPTVWPGTGTVALFNTADPSAALSPAYVSGATIVDDALIAKLSVKLLAPVSALTPTYLSYSEIKGSTAEAFKLTGTVQLGTLVFTLSSCAEVPGSCDDNNACTTDACNTISGQCEHNAVVCDDNDVCTGQETCDEATGCVAGTPLNCEDDDDACTEALCDATLGCHAPVNCDDGFACTADSCDPATGCDYVANASLCNDGVGCTADSCELGTGCVNAPNNGACDDGDVCTTNVCDETLDCIYPPLNTGDCLPAGTFCGVSGVAGTLAECEIRLARSTQSTPVPTSGQFDIVFDSALVQPQSFTDLTCFGPGGTEPCADITVPPGSLYPSGHTVVLTGADPPLWSDSGSVVLFNTSDPTVGVTDAFMQLGAVTGDALVMKLWVEVQTDIPSTAPVYLSYADIKGATATALKMVGSTEQGAMVLSLADCTVDPGVCDDNNACTTDSCNLSTKVCEYATVVCSDDDVCNGLETCDPATGCVAGSALSCPDDGNLCTVESCDATAGCIATSPCDDGVACTIDGCDPDDGSCSATADNSACSDGIGCTTDVCDEVTGCEYTANAGACNDGNPCTADSCNVSTGCVFTPLLTAACLPNGAVCGFAGAASSTQTCELRLARATVETGVPAGAQFRLVYPASQLTVTSLQDLVCFGPGGTEPCAMVDVPPQALYPTGHTVKLTPATVNTWSGVGNVVLFNLADPSSAVTGAYLSGGTVIGDAVFMTLTVTLTATIPAGTPVYIQAQSIKGSTPTAGALTGFATAGTMVLQDAGCAAICNDGNACTVDTCNAVTGTCVFTAKVCDDGDVCTGAETCNPAIGCVAGTTLTCPDDGNACTLAGCDPTVGCNAPDPCDDGITCTSTACDPGVGCTYAEQNGLCDDGLACTADFCSAATGCWHTTDDAACDDADPCTADVCVEGEGCQHPPLLTPECLPAGTFCGVTGNAGDTVECLIRVARSSQAMPEPASAQFDIGFSSALVQVMGMTDLVCLGPGGTEPCVDLPTPPANLYPSGHTVVLNSADPTVWPGTGTVALFNTADPSAALSPAYVSGATIVDDALIAKLSVKLLAPVSALTPTYLSYSDIKGSTAEAFKLTGTVQLGTLVFTLSSCAEVPGSCDDNNACTTDVCNATSGQCEHNAVVCDDNDVCTGQETCDEATGCVAGTPLNCEDDDDACTEALCDATLGCHAPVNCDDGFACTADSCDPATGCEYVANASLCNDGVGCTADSCELGTGCVNAPTNGACDDGDVCTTNVCDETLDCIYPPLNTGDCLPAGTFCGVSGVAGTLAECEIRLARSTQSTPVPTSGQFDIMFDSALVQPQSFTDLTCFGPGGTEPCADITVPPGTLYPSGHTVVLTGADPPLWSDSGSVVLFNTSDPTVGVTDAFMQLGAVTGDALVMKLWVEVQTDIPSTAPVYLSYANIKGATATALKMVGSTDQGTMVLSLADCTVDPGVCDDNNACTTDSCNLSTKACEYAAVVCSDNDVCNGLETCDPATGCVGGSALSCPDDGNLCTVESCDATAGCITTSPCDDGVACTLDGCDPDDGSCSVTADNSACDDGIGCTLDVCDEVTGCEYTANAGACDDGNPCTADSCDLSTGCVFTPLLTAACLPNGAVCGFAGAASSTQTCQLRLARATVETGLPAGAQFRLVYPTAQLTVTSLQDLVCFGPGGTEPCAMVDVPPQALYPTGHTVKLTPATVNTWAGIGNVVLFNLADPASAVTSAYLSGGTVVGDAVFMTMTVTLKTNISALTPVYVQAQSIKGSTPTAGALTGFATGGTMILQDSGCAAICNDNNACTVDTCNAVTGTCVFTAKVCDDGDVCTGAETCNPATGCVAGTTLTCPDDGNACTLPGCDPVVGCNAPDPCDDGITCTSTACDPGVGCTYAEQNGLCDDGLACTADFCSAATGCWHETDDAACDDNDPCTADVCVEGEGCQHPPLLTPECLPAGTFCGVTGNAGDTVACTIRVAAATPAMPLPTGIQFAVTFEPELVQPQNVQDYACFGPGGTEPCAWVDLPPANLYPSGHTVVLDDPDPETWPGFGEVVVFNTADPTSPVSSAYVHLGTMVGDTQVATLVVQLQDDISPLTPTYLSYLNIKGTTEDAAKLVGTVMDGTMVMSAEDCTTDPSVCDDQNACTTDSCNPVSKECVYSAVTCDDGDVCNGLESCNPLVGCESGVPLDCQADEDLCTLDICDPITGCGHPPTCDDGVACTIDQCDEAGECTFVPNDGACDDGVLCSVDSCDVTLGCVAVGDDGACDDGDGCTQDQCDTQIGCVYLPEITTECLPAGAVCGVAGTSGATYICPLHVTRATTTTPTVAGLQFSLSYNDAQVTVTTFQDLVCFGENGAPPCASVDVPPASLFPSGHSVVLFPADVADWAGAGDLVLFNTSDSAAAVSDAFWDDAQVQGDALFIELHLTLDQSIDPAAPMYVYANTIKGSTPDAGKLVGDTHAGMMRLHVEDCNDYPGVCDDGNACTADACNPTSGQCEYTTIGGCP